MATGVKKAISLFERGLLLPAVDALRNARMDAQSHDDDEAVAEVESVADQMRAHLDPNELRFFNDRFAGIAAPLDDGDVVSPIGLALAFVGALAMVIAVFLPYVEAKSFARVEQNTLIQHGNGWWFIGIAVVGAVTVSRAYVKRKPSPGPLILGVIAIGVAIYYGTNKHNLTLCVVGSNPLNVPCEKANPGVGIYVAGVGGLLMALGGGQMLMASDAARRRFSGDVADTKICPECAETVKLAARVCKHCGYRFEPQGA